MVTPRRQWGPTPTGWAALTAVAACIGLAAAGGSLFSPGDVNGDSRKGGELGGVSSHAAIRSCSGCHPGPSSGDSMADRCTNCHAEVRREIDDKRSLHGKLPAGTSCGGCHAEHRGPHAPLTDFARFDHGFTDFPLTGKHRDRACAGCHVEGSAFKGTAKSCVGCHARPAVPAVHHHDYGAASARPAMTRPRGRERRSATTSASTTATASATTPASSATPSPTTSGRTRAIPAMRTRKTRSRRRTPSGGSRTFPLAPTATRPAAAGKESRERVPGRTVTWAAGNSRLRSYWSGCPPSRTSSRRRMSYNRCPRPSGRRSSCSSCPRGGRN